MSCSLAFATKHEARAWGRARRAALSPEVRRSASREIAGALRARLFARLVPDQLLLYRATPDEVDTSALFAPPAVDELYVPRIRGVEMEWVRVGKDTAWFRGAFGIPEPRGEQLWMPGSGRRAVVLCPLTAFDRRGGRVGMGKGFFDRWLAECGEALSAIAGLAFSCQEAGRVPMEFHDHRMQWVITEKEIIACHSES